MLGTHCQKEVGGRTGGFVAPQPVAILDAPLLYLSLPSLNKLCSSLSKQSSHLLHLSVHSLVLCLKPPLHYDISHIRIICVFLI